MGMTFNSGTFYPPEKKKKKDKKVTTKGNTVKEEKESNKFAKAVKPVFDKKEGMKKELAIVQLEDSLTKEDKSKLSTKGVEKVASAAADDAQLTKSLQKMERDLMRSGGRAGYKSGTRGCKLAIKGKGRAYGKNS